MLICNSCCSDVNPIKHFQNVKVNAQNIHLIMISESVSQNIIDYFDGEGTPVFIKNTNTLFNEIGYNYKTYKDYLNNGIYLTTALKCVKKEYVVSAQTIEACSFILEKEIEPFINAKVILLMGDFAIKAINYICKRKYKQKVLPNGSTYKIRNDEYIYNGIRFMPSYTQTGDSFGIEKSKLRMMEEDIQRAMEILRMNGG